MRAILDPSRAVSLAFLVVIAAGTGLLMLPMSNAQGLDTPWLTALFTTVSAVCVTGLAVVDTGTYWSPLGQWIILGLFQVGGFGVMTAATLVGLLVNPSLRLRTRLVVQAETHAVGLGDVRSIAKLVFIVTALTELGVAVALALRLRYGYGQDWGTAAWSGFFHSVSAFNNAGFSIYEDNLMRFATDAWICLPVMLAIAVGGIGFPVIQDIQSHRKDPRQWTLHTKLTLVGSASLLLLGLAGTLLFEWNNDKTLGPMAVADKLLTAAFTSVSARTAGFNSIDIGALNRESLALHYFLMFIGGGSAGTAGGVKVGTAVILAMLVLAEVRGHNDSEAFGRRIGLDVQRQAITVLVLGCALVVVGILVLLAATDFPTDQVVFEVVSAFGTVGLSTGITAKLPESGQLALVLLMYAGRVGTVTLAASLALGERHMPYRYPEESPIVG